MTIMARACPRIAGLSAAGLYSGQAKAATFDIDIVHSHVAFFIDHLGFSKVIGTVNDFSGTFDFDAAKPEASALDVTLKVVQHLDQQRAAGQRHPGRRLVQCHRVPGDHLRRQGIQEDRRQDRDDPWRPDDRGRDAAGHA